jgi:epoxyqueuosine reductase
MNTVQTHVNPHLSTAGSTGGPGKERDWSELLARIRAWGRELGFQSLGVSDTELSEAEAGLARWLAAGYHGELDYMARHGDKRTRPALLHPGTLRVISARMNYLALGSDGGGEAVAPQAVLADPARAYVSRYALGRDYHKVLRSRLQALASRMVAAVGPFGYRVFTDSAPVMEVELARKSGLGWRGKHTLLLSREAGSAFFLGEIYTDLPLPVDEPVSEHCGSCARCITTCPTGAIVAPYRLDARRCISYLTIELKGSIPEELRPLLGNRVYGCDDCQLACPWNSFAQSTGEPDFQVRNGLDNAELVALFAWEEPEFLARMAGSAILRIGHERWLRNLAVGLGNALRRLAAERHPVGLPAAAEVRKLVAALEARRDHASALVREHVAWALAQHPLNGRGAAA